MSRWQNHPVPTEEERDDDGNTAILFIIFSLVTCVLMLTAAFILGTAI
jgi:hypothetical protein